jgi:Vanillate O-demethylase oxygenase C-terminal domain
VKIEGGSRRSGADSAEGNTSGGMSIRNLNAITPETNTTTHYFWGNAENFAANDPTLIDTVFKQINTAFLEDLEIIGALQANIVSYGDALPREVSFAQDAGGVQVRRIVERLIAAEREERVAAPV